MIRKSKVLTIAGYECPYIYGVYKVYKTKQGNVFVQRERIHAVLGFSYDIEKRYIPARKAGIEFMEFVGYHYLTWEVEHKFKAFFK